MGTNIFVHVYLVCSHDVWLVRLDKDVLMPWNHSNTLHLLLTVTMMLMRGQLYEVDGGEGSLRNHLFSV